MEAKDKLLKREASKNASLAVDLKKPQAKVGQMWKAALTKVRVPGDDPTLRNPPKFPSSGFVASSSADPPSAPKVPPKVPPAVASADPHSASKVPPEVPPAVDVAHGAGPVTSEAAPTDPEAGLPEAGVPQGIDCNVEAVAP